MRAWTAAAILGMMLALPVPSAAGAGSAPRGCDPIDPTPCDRADGFSPGAPILLRVPGSDARSRVIDVCVPRPCYLAGWTGP